MADRTAQLRELIDTVAPCWAGEALVAGRYFGSGHRTPERDVRWIGFQVFKEFNGGGVYGGPGATVASILDAASRRAAAISLATPPGEVTRILDDLNFAVDELRHMAQFMGLYALAGGDPGRSLESLGDLENARRLLALRHSLRQTAVGRTAVDLSEGGGLGLQFGMRAHFAASPPVTDVDREMVRLSERILADESAHILAKFRSTDQLDDDERTWSGLTASLLAISVQKLKERNEQFSGPLAEDELLAVAADRDLGRQYVSRHLGFLTAGL
jgi:hypothetical protein